MLRRGRPPKAGQKNSRVQKFDCPVSGCEYSARIDNLWSGHLKKLVILTDGDGEFEKVEKIHSKAAKIHTNWARDSGIDFKQKLSPPELKLKLSPLSNAQPTLSAFMFSSRNKKRKQEEDKEEDEE